MSICKPDIKHHTRVQSNHKKCGCYSYTEVNLTNSTKRLKLL